MKAVAVYLQKGGTGKTSLSGSIAYELAKRGPTALLDFDPQGNASSWFLTAAPQHELAEALSGAVEVAEAITPTGTPGLDLLPTFGLDGSLKAYAENRLADEPYICVDLVAELSRLGYAYAVLDLSPGMGRLERAALLAAGEVITPILPEYFSLDGLETFTHELARLKNAMRTAPEHRILVVNGFDARIGQHRTIAGQADEIAGKTVFRVPVDPAFRKAQARHVPVQALPHDESAKEDTITALLGITEAIA